MGGKTVSGIFGKLESEWDHTLGALVHHDHGESAKGADPYPTMAAEPAAPEGDSMSLATIDAGIKTDLTDGLEYAEGLIARLKSAAPGIISTAETVGGSTVSTVVEAVAGRILPPQLESILGGIVKDFVDRAEQAGQTTTTAAAPAAPAN